MKIVNRTGGMIDIMDGNERIGYVDENSNMFGFNSAGNAVPVCPIGHRAEIIGKFKKWQDGELTEQLV